MKNGSFAQLLVLKRFFPSSLSTKSLIVFLPGYVLQHQKADIDSQNLNFRVTGVLANFRMLFQHPKA
jgi:hypothetical protein